MIIIGITGTLGAGKGTIVDFLVKEKGFTHYSVRGFLVDEIKRQNLEVNRDSMTSVANQLRTQNSPSFIIDQLYKQAAEQGENCVIESIRTEGEINSLRKKDNFYLLAVDADQDIRYHRIQIRKSSTDDVTKETFVQNEQREFESTDPNKQNLKRCIELADFVLMNDGSLSDLSLQIEKIMNQITKA